MFIALQGRLHHRRLGANAPKKFLGGRFLGKLGGKCNLKKKFKYVNF
jgi:hypothetical protein